MFILFHQHNTNQSMTAVSFEPLGSKTSISVQNEVIQPGQSLCVHGLSMSLTLLSRCNDYMMFPSHSGEIYSCITIVWCCKKQIKRNDSVYLVLCHTLPVTEFRLRNRLWIKSWLRLLDNLFFF